MKKIIAIAAAAVMLASLAGCSDSSSKAEIASSSSAQVVNTAASKLTSRMTQTEKQRVSLHGLTLLNEAKADGNEQHKVGIVFHTVTEQEYMDNLKMSLEQGLITQKQYDEQKGNSTEHSYASSAYIDGQSAAADVMILQQFAESDNPVEFAVTDPKDAEKQNTIKVNNFAEYLDWLKRYRMSCGDSSEQAESAVKQAELIKKALADKSYETIPESSGQNTNYGGYDPYIDYRSGWEFDRESAQSLKDRIKEIDIYDEQLDTQFLAHVVLPKNYDKDKAYPVMFMTDGVYRFGDALRMTKMMDEGKAQEAIIVTLSYGYHYDGTNEGLRMKYLVGERTKLVDFITDDLMPYVSENFKIDCTKSTLYGHSDGGVFAHCALMTSDKYENQPFSAYIIGSPVFWATYEMESYDSKSVENDYGYWDRNEKLGKKVFLCAGSLEDSDYASSFNGHATTLEGLASLKERLEKHSTNVKYKLYETHHYQFIPDMLDEWLTEYYKK